MQRQQGSIKNKIVATELLEERKNCDFDQEELYCIYIKDPEVRAMKEKVQKDLMNDPILCNTHKYYEWTPQEIQENWMKKIKRAWEVDRHFYIQKRPHPQFMWIYCHQGQPPIGLHSTMFTQSIDQFSTDEQRAKWLPLCTNLDILGCYAQTEIGHGSNVAGLETTATFDKNTDEFVIHTETPTATKWWPGEMGRISNHALVFARLIIEDEGEKNDYGICPFVVQIRDRETHKHMPGVKSGDLGPKLGYVGKDNGWLTMDKVRIPRENMLQRFIKVDNDGSVSIQGDLRVLYSTMLMIRVMLVGGSKHYLAYGLTIALRYSAVRRQFKNISGKKEETQLLDYQTQQMKLFPLLATCFAHSISSDHITEKFQQLLKDIKKQNFKNLDLLHHYTSGMKSIYTQDCYDGLLQMRQSLGGAGYSAWSGIPKLIEDYSPQVTFEGDNTVMAQQSTNFLLKQARKALQGKSRAKFDDVFSYLSQMKELISSKCLARKPEDFLDLDLIEHALKVNISQKISQILKHAKESSDKVSKKDFINSKYSLDIVKASNAHIRYVTFWFFKKKVESDDIKCPGNKKILKNLCMLYGLFTLSNDCVSCYESGYFSTDVGLPFSELILQAIKILNTEIRPKAISIVESLNITDEVLQSAIGNSYGDIYETHLEWAKDSRLNKTKLGDAIPDGFMDHMMPILKAKM